ncbi:MAG: hypothetical protein LUQ54_05195 [Methanoregula sp.]|nr:hypothetical protein [Methanoregula sp.]
MCKDDSNNNLYRQALLSHAKEGWLMEETELDVDSAKRSLMWHSSSMEN